MTVFILISVLSVFLVAWFIHASRPLSPTEIEDFARRKRLLAIENHYSFNDDRVPVDIKFKSAMDAEGKLYRTDEPVNRFPSTAASLLKWKKHEWIMFAFSRAGRVMAIWMNKGPDKEKVWSVVSTETIVEMAKQMGADTVVDFHNHPNPNPHRLLMCLPSHQDNISATTIGSKFVSHGIAFLAFVAERGRHFQYACWAPDSLCPLEPYLSEVCSRNGTSRFVNLRLRREHRTKSRLASFLQYKDASENIGFVRHPQPTLIAPKPVIAHPPQRPPKSEPSPQPTPRPSFILRLTLTPVQSSNLLAIGYDRHHQLLEIAFRNGSTYQYHSVPESEYYGLMSAPSKGKYFNKRIVGGGYPCVQVNRDTYS
jgi:hypothetical protein